MFYTYIIWLINSVPCLIVRNNYTWNVADGIGEYGDEVEIRYHSC